MLEFTHRVMGPTCGKVLEKLKPGTMAKYGLDYATLSQVNERRTALDELVQMMGGLADMTGRPGDSLRAVSTCCSTRRPPRRRR